MTKTNEKIYLLTNSFSKHVLKEVSKIKSKEPDKVLVIIVNTAKEKSS